MWRQLVGIVLVVVLVSGCHGIATGAHQTSVKTMDRITPHSPRVVGTASRSQDAGLPHTKPTRVVELGALPELDAILPRLAKKRVIFIGETHTRLADHLNQLAIIQGLWAQGKTLAIGMESFQQPFQSHLDDFIAGNTDDATELLARTEYYERWRYDYRLYQPILDFAREQKIPLIALNVSSELVKKVSENGWDALVRDNTLTKEERAQLPQTIDRSNRAYEERLREVFRQHGAIDRKASSDMKEGKEKHQKRGVTDFGRFMDVQLLWDEGMAKRAAEYVAEHPSVTLIVLAGSGHLVHGDGIPDRLRKRVDVDTAIVLPVGAETDVDMADFLLVSEERLLPPAGRLGILLEKNAEVASFMAESAARDAGIELQDRIRSIDKRPIASLADIKLALWNKRPGDRVSVQVHRTHWITEKDLRFEVRLR
uniref:Uncharacterized iron-regulated protein n=1 Tax=Candidatus Kentrum sp. MB TaxID=2138164 RepID=A0A451B739_9GAMM|nr:MAG: Uncharacterized iron-regulated protein [Candidatus Kentron sp. MB]VFK28767.1 MAG: Uncharacterized iron-regulated protein [Candidatus Kentron sp. MB]VFK74084.1 MAG: Uncharacterized iron-regulated protein [Candidatus Kentron sp. MB]